MDSELGFDPAETFNEVAEILESLELTGGWQIISLLPNGSIKMRKDLDDSEILASETFISKSPAAILEAITTPEIRQKWDLSFISSTRIQHWGKNLQLIHFVQRLKWPISDRDFVLVQGVATNPDERITIGWRSVEYDKKPLSGSYVRGRVVFAGFVITKVDNDNSHVSYYEKSISNVSVPKFFKKKIQIRAVQLPFLLKTYFN